MNTPKILGQLWYIALFWLVLGLVYVAILLSVIAYTGSLYKTMDPMIPVTIFFGALMFFTKNEKTFRKTVKAVLLLRRLVFKKHIRSKYKMDISDLKKLYPIESIEPDGLIRYVDRSAAYLMVLLTHRVPDEELDKHNTLMKSVVESLHGKYTLRLYKISVLERNSDLAKEVVSNMTDQSKTVEQKQHLLKLYEHSQETHTPIVDWTDLAILTIPPTDSVDKAQVMGRNMVSGISNGYLRAGTTVTLVGDRNLVAEYLRTMALPLPRR